MVNSLWVRCTVGVWVWCLIYLRLQKGGAGRPGNHQPRMGWNEMGYEARKTILYERRGRKGERMGRSKKEEIESAAQSRPPDRKTDRQTERKGRIDEAGKGTDV